MPDNNYEYPYGDAQTHEALADLDRRLKALEPKPDEPVVAEHPFVETTAQAERTLQDRTLSDWRTPASDAEAVD